MRANARKPGGTSGVPGGSLHREIPRRARLNPSLTPRPIAEVARDLGIDPKNVIVYGDDKAKIRLAAHADGARDRPPGRLVLVSAITPTGAGEGKTTTSIGLA